MRIGYGKTVLDPYEWLPGYGETSIKIFFDGGNLNVAILYDSDSVETEKILSFESVFHFDFQSFPGPSLFLPSNTDMKLLLEGKLVEYSNSEAATAWNRHFSEHKVARHFKILFLSANYSLDVIATNFSLER